MKRTITSLRNALLVLCLLFSASRGSAQIAGVGPYLGIKAGANFSSIKGETWENGIKANLAAGLYAGFKAEHIGVQVEALFSQSDYVTGSDFHDVYGSYYQNIGDSVKKGMFRVNKLSIPLLFQFKILPGLWIQLGPQYTGIVSVKDMDNLVTDAKSMFKTNNIQGVAGATFNLGNFNVGARYIFDFSDINNTNVNADDVWKERVLQIHVGLKIL
jgi:hypothetical protein